MMRRNVPIVGALGSLAFTLAIGVSPLAVTAVTLPKGSDIEVTGYRQVCCDGQSGPVVVRANGSAAAALRAAVTNLVPTTSQVSICVETVIPFRLTVVPPKTSQPSFEVTGTSCGGQFVTIQHGGITAVFKNDCTLERAVVGVLPRHKAQGTRQEFAQPCLVDSRAQD
jgi:hypothetical protein